MPILGTIASQVPANLPTGSYESIQTVIVPSGGTSTITFNSIPQTYKHLQLRSVARDASSGYDTNSFKIVINNDTSSGYARQGIGGDTNNNTYSFREYSTGFGYTGGIARNGTMSNLFAASIVTFFDYSSTDKYKNFMSFSGATFNGEGTGNVGAGSGIYVSTNAITSISFTSSQNANFLQNSQFALYGMKGE
jgi:hypothetical protein